MKKFDNLSEQEILALAISLEEEDERVYADFAEGLRENFPASAAVFDDMRADETGFVACGPTHPGLICSLFFITSSIWNTVLVKISRIPRRRIVHHYKSHCPGSDTQVMWLASVVHHV